MILLDVLIANNALSSQNSLWRKCIWNINMHSWIDSRKKCWKMCTLLYKKEHIDSSGTYQPYFYAYNYRMFKKIYFFLEVFDIFCRLSLTRNGLKRQIIAWLPSMHWFGKTNHFSGTPCSISTEHIPRLYMCTQEIYCECFAVIGYD